MNVNPRIDVMAGTIRVWAMSEKMMRKKIRQIVSAIPVKNCGEDRWQVSRRCTACTTRDNTEALSLIPLTGG
jgi:hypothetical protein